MKVGRNDLCPCGSGRKFKKCHWNMPPIPLVRSAAKPSFNLPPHIWTQFEQNRLREEARVAQFGHVREAVHLPDFKGYRFVGVRGSLYFSKTWKFFSDFLFEYGLLRFGKDW